MEDSTKLLQKIQKAMRINKRPQTTLEVNGNNGPSIRFEEIRVHDLQDLDLEDMCGDQLFGHPAIKEMKEAKKG